MKGFEYQISERIDELCGIIQTSLACNDNVVDFTAYIRYGTAANSHANRLRLTKLDSSLVMFLIILVTENLLVA